MILKYLTIGLCCYPMLVLAAIEADLLRFIQQQDWLDSVAIIEWQGQSYAVAVAKVDFDGEMMSRLSLARTLAEAALSQFIHGEQIQSSESLRGIRIIEKKGSTAKIRYADEYLIETIRSRSRGIITYQQQDFWRQGQQLFYAIIMPLAPQ